ncbi:MAG TPA: phenylalanine--tRNA ligase subunit alpha, partial [Nitrososphaeraceae archaeon]
MQDNKSQLHPIEKSLLKTLADNQSTTIEILSETTGLKIDQVRRGIEWLKYKDLVLIKDKSTVKISLGKNGLNAIDNGFPERRLVDLVKQGSDTMRKLANAGVFRD